VLYSKAVKMMKNTKDLYPNLDKAEAMVIDNLMYRHWNYWNDESFEHLHYAIIDLADGNKIMTNKDIMPDANWDVPVPPFDGSEDYTLSPDGKTIVYVAKPKFGLEFAESTNTDLYAYSLETEQTVNLTEGMMGYDKNPSFSPDGKLLAFTSMERDGYESDANLLWIMNMETGLKSPTNSAEYVNGYTWANNKTIYYSFDEKATKQVAKLTIKKFQESKSGNLTIDVSVNTLTNGDFNYGHVMTAGKTLLAHRSDMNHANEVFSINSKGEATALTQVNDAIYSELKMSKVEKRMVKTTDGKDMLTWVIYPPDFDETKKYPTLLYCQGGPQSAVSQFYSFRWNFQLMAAKGYIVVAPNRRGLPGFGTEWNEAISKDWGGQAMRDYLAAIDDVAKEPWADENKLGAVGASYGGYSVYMLAGIHEKRFKTFISHCGLYNLESWYGVTEELFFANWDIGGAYWDNPMPESYAKFSPHKYVQNWDTPILVIHGGKDFRVPENQGMEAFQAAQIKGIPSKFLYFPNEGHWVLSPQNGLIWHDQFFGWLDQWLKNE
jgi:dipeptidyl aminopeptidase/acylaminoacyl peptidase